LKNLFNNTVTDFSNCFKNCTSLTTLDILLINYDKHLIKNDRIKKLNKLFGVSERSICEVENGKVITKEILSYDFVGNPGFISAKLDWSITNEHLRRIDEMLKREQLLKDRKEKINKLNS